MDVFDKTAAIKLIRMLKEKNLYPFFRVIDSSTGANVTHKNKDLIMMGSNNYLGLTHDPRVKKAATDAIETWGTGCTGSRFLNGNLSIHEKLEEKIKDFFGYEAALVFSSGFLANQGAISSLIGPEDTIFSDSENHACIIEGCRLAEGKTIVYKHNDMKDLEEKLRSIPLEAPKLIITDGVFSMNGRIVEFDVIDRLAKKYNARTYIDEAHSIGVIGPGGRGTAAHFGIKADVLMGTFSKSLASQGGFICGSKEVIEWIQLKGRTIMFSAALSPANVETAYKALEILEGEPRLVAELQEKSSYLKKALDAEGFDTMGSQTSIIPIFTGDDKKALSLSYLLQDQGVFVTPVVYPAVPKGESVIRCSVMVNHTYEELDRVVSAMKKFKKLILDHSQNSSQSLHELLNENMSQEEIMRKSQI